MVVASGTTDGQAQPDRAGRVHSIFGIDGVDLFRNDPTFIGGDVAAVKSGSNLLVKCPIREQVSSELLDGKAIERQIAIEGLDNPVAIRPHLSIVVDVDTMRVGIARSVKPVTGAMLSPALGGQQAVHNLLVGIL